MMRLCAGLAAALAVASVTVITLPAEALTLAPRWVASVGAAVDSSPALAAGNVYVGTDAGNLVALDATTGASVWATNLGGAVDSSPVVADGVVFVGSDDAKVYALRASTGQILWTTTTGGPVDSSPVVADGVVYLGSDSGSLVALDAATGAVGAAMPTGGPVDSSPVVADGVVFVGSDSATTWAFTVDADDDGVLDIVDLCPGTVPDGADPDSLSVRHYAWFGGTQFLSGGARDPVFTLSETRGCSGEQIALELGLGSGSTKMGISYGSMSRWVRSVSGA